MKRVCNENDDCGDIDASSVLSTVLLRKMKSKSWLVFLITIE